jgi:hypothetical protein
MPQKVSHDGQRVTASNPFPVYSPAGSPSAVVGLGYSPAITFTRPENTTLYTAGDVLGIADSGTPANAGSAIHELANAGPAGGLVFFSELLLQVGLTAVPSGMANFRLHVFNASPTAILDNAAFDLQSADRDKYLGYLDIVTPEDFGSTLVGEGVLRGKSFKLADGQTSLWVILETRGGYTPASATSYRIQAKTERAA